MKPFLHGRKDSAVASLAPHDAPPVSGMASVLRSHSSTGGGPSPTIDVVKEGDKVVRLVITCSCGERMEVECIYPAGA